MGYKLINEEFEEELEIGSDMAKVTIGRADNNNIVLSSDRFRGTKKFPRRYGVLSSVSRYHGVFEKEPIGGGYLLYFTNFGRYGSSWSMSEGGNGFKEVEGSVLLYPDCLLKLGRELVYRIGYVSDNSVSEPAGLSKVLLRTTTATIKETFRKTLGRLIG